MNAFAQNVTRAIKSGVFAAFALLSNVIANILAASAAANAVENHRQPAASDLRRLGLEGVTFNVNA